MPAAEYRPASSLSSSTSTSTSTLVSDSSIPQNSRMDDQQFITTFFCRAKYDYQSADDASLSFRRGDIIEVLTRLDTGWWDGLLGEDRGWFPSNYVDIISDEEADIGLAALELQQQQQQQQQVNVQLMPTYPLSSSQSTSTQSALARSSMAPSRLHNDQRTWPDGDTDSSSRNGHSVDGLPITSVESETLPSDYWVPRVTPDGQIYYVNTQTGQRSRDLPIDADGDLSDVDFRASTQRVRPELAIDPYGPSNGARNDRTAGFGLPKRTGTPEPWVRRLADDGLSYFYQNKHDGTVQWTLPETNSAPRTNGRPSTAGAHSQNDLAVGIDQRHHSRQQSDSTYVRIGHNDSLIGNGNVYSDDSDVDPLDRYTGFRKSNQTSSSTTQVDSHPRTVSQITAQPLPSVLSDSDPQLTSAEKFAQALQHTLTPPPPDPVTALSTVARQSVAAIVTAVQSHDPSARPSSQNLLEDRILASVVALRHLLYVSSPPYGHVPSHLYRKDGPASGPSIPQSLQAQLKPAQRRVTATLSKLVLAALAAQYDTISLTSEVSERMETDAAELDRALVTFVNEVQKIHNQMPQPPSRRLFASLLPANVGLGLMGAGAAAGWKGLGWAPVDSQRQPKLDLSSEVLAELKIEIAELEERLVDLHSAVFDGSAASAIHPLGQSAVAWLHSVLSFFVDINLARTVDVDGIGREGHSGDVYLQSVHKARTLARAFEALLQSLFDDGASVLLAITTPASRQSGPTSFPSERVRSLVASLKINVAQAFQTLEALLVVGQEQVAKGPSDHRDSIGWRMSRIVNIDSNLERTLKELASEDESYDEGGEELVDMEHAFARKPAPLKPSASLERSASEMYSNPSQTSESSLEPPRVHSEDATPLAIYPDNNMTAIPSPPSLPGSDAAAGSLEDEDTTSPSSNGKAPAGAADKLLRVLGDAPTHIIDKLNAKTKPWYLRPNYEDSEIQMDPDGKVRAGTIPALVERLTAHEHSDMTFTKTFLLTYKSFTDVETLFNVLVTRFWIKPPEGLTPPELEDWTKHKQHIIRMRVLNTFKTMITDEDALAEEDLFILDKMKEMVSGSEVIHFGAAKQLLSLIERAQRGESRTKTAMSLDPQPIPLIPRTSRKLKLLDFDPLEVARQLTMIECQLYMKIKPSECLMRSREHRSENHDSIAAIIVTTNKIAHWVADTVLSKEDSRKRANIVKQFISVAERCRELKNFSSMIAIVSGLNSPPIRRLKRTWDQINPRFMSMLGTGEMTIDSNKNFSNYRSLLQRITPPCVPFVGLYLTTLTFIQDGAPNNIGTLVNFRKRQKAAEVIEEIQKWQSKPFNYAKVDLIHDYIMNCLSKFDNRPDVSDEFWNLSLEREPREREDERMARLLQETGFL